MKTNKGVLIILAAAALALCMPHPAGADPVLLAHRTFNQNSDDVSGNGLKLPAASGGESSICMEKDI
jgi:hypothetical protein